MKEIISLNPYMNIVKVNYNFSEGYFNFRRKRYYLKDYQKYLLKYYSELCLKYFLRSLPIGEGKYKRIFAWETIYHEAEKKGILIDYIINHLTPKFYERKPERPTEPTVQ